MVPAAGIEPASLTAASFKPAAFTMRFATRGSSMLHTAAWTSTSQRIDMPNIGAALKEEIARLARKVVKTDTRTLHSSSAAHRRHIAALRRQVSTLEREIAALKKPTAKSTKSSALLDETTSQGPNVRVSAKGLKSLRERLGISQEELGLLVGVSSQSIYNWEKAGVSKRKGHREAVAALRTVGKREIAQRLQALKKPKTSAKKAAKGRPRKSATR